jgi:hypothetical protein
MREKKQVHYYCRDCKKLVSTWLYDGYYFLEERKYCIPCHYGYHQDDSFVDRLWDNIDNLQGGW